MSEKYGAYYTLGLIGTFTPDLFLFTFIDTQAERYHDSDKKLCILLSLITTLHLPIAEHILKLKQLFRDLRLEVAVREKDWDIHERGCISIEGQTRNRIIDMADAFHIIREHTLEAQLQALQRLFAKNADEIVYATQKDAKFFANVNFFMRNPPLATCYTPKVLPKSRTVESARLLILSIDFIRTKNFRIKANDIPDELLTLWTANDTKAYEPYLGRLDDTADLLRMTDIDGHFLPFKIFTYAYSIYNNLWAFGHAWPDDVQRRFTQFQILLRRIAAARYRGRNMDFVEIFDFDHYDCNLHFTNWADDIDDKQGEGERTWLEKV